ncbi:hypothetical protein [Kitasatospora sp. A2-31]|uniref:hypothetical protein n=1 Tax=Kitasatospora sp. A2-31 TaxID=2916414 RepID=UPI001EEE76CC|nr:hypothetical protein [Kitasatospora sp. A2-31]MCG6498783.1 hypothetical protein [Kitasatospora sp. A2-31]
MRIKRVVAAAAAVLALGPATGCDGGVDDAKSAAPPVTSPSTERLESMTGVVILDRAHGEFLKAASVKLTGTVTDKARTTATFTVSVKATGDCTGFLELDGNGRAELLRASGQTLVKPSSKALAEYFGLPTTEFRADRWIRLAKSEASDALPSGMCDLKTVPLFGDGDWSKTVNSEGTETVNGRKVVTVFASTPEDGAYLGYVATDGPARPARIKSFHSEGHDIGLTVDFSDYDAPVAVTLPPADQITDPAATR